MTKETKKKRNKYIFFRDLSFLFTLAPVIVYVLIGFIDGSIHRGQKIFLGFTVISSLILVIVNSIMKYHLRSPLFLLLLGTYYALENILTLIIILSIGIILDEFILSPLASKYKQEYIINKELDKRLENS